MPLDVGAVVGSLQLQNSWSATLQTAATDQQAFETRASSSFAGVGVSAETAGVKVSGASASMVASAIALQSKLVLQESAAASAGSALRTLADEINKSGTATQAQLGGLTDLTATHLALKGAIASTKDELAALAPVAEHTGVSTKALGENITQFIEHPVDAAKTTLLGFAETLGPAGVAIAAISTVAIAAGVGLFELATKAAAVGSRLDDLSDKTGLSVPALSRLSNATQIIGADMNSLSDVVFKLQRGIGENTEVFQTGLKRMGLSTDELKAAGPDRYLELITAGLKGIVDPSDRAAAGQEVLGRGYKDVAHALMDLDAGMAATADLTPWTAAQAREAELFEQQIASIETHAKAAGIAVGQELIPAMSLLASGLTEGAKAAVAFADVYSGGLFTDLKLVHEAWAAAADITSVFKTKLGELRDGMGELPAPVTSAADAVEHWAHVVTSFSWGQLAHEAIADVAAGVRVLAHDMGTLPDVSGPAALGLDKIKKSLDNLQFHGVTMSVEEQDAAIKKLTESYDKWAAVVADVESAGNGWKGTLDTIDGAVVEQMRSLTAAGVPLKTLETYYGLTTTQGNAFTKMLEAEKKATDDVAKAQATADALRMTSYTAQITNLKAIEASSAKAYGTVSQIAALQQLDKAEQALTASVYASITSEKDRMKLIEENGTRHIEILNQITALENKRAGVVNAQVIAELNAQTQLNAAYGLTASGGMAHQETALDRLNKGMAALQVTAQAGVSQKAQIQVLENTYTQELLAEAVAQDQLNGVMATGNGIIAQVPTVVGTAVTAMKWLADQTISDMMKLNASQEAAIAKAKATSDAASAATAAKAAIQYTVNSAFSLGGSADANAKAAAAAGGVVNLDDYGNPYTYIAGTNAPGHRAMGGAVQAGQSYLVGDRADKQPEIFTPGASGFITPQGASAAPTVVNATIYVNGTAADVARKVAAELMKIVNQAGPQGRR